MDTLKRSAAKAVSAWAEGKDFFAMMRTLDAFEGLGAHMAKGVGTSRALEPGAPPPAIKKAFHKASLSLHPDRLLGLDTYQRCEAEELFKVLSSSFDEARKAALSA